MFPRFVLFCGQIEKQPYIYFLDLFINFVCFFQGILAAGSIFLPLLILHLMGKDSSMIMRLLLNDHTDKKNVTKWGIFIQEFSLRQLTKL
jgi:hypothetical protein